MESPGRFRSAVGAVLDVLDQLRAILPIDDVLLVGEREGGYAVARAALSAAGVARRVVVIDGGGVTKAALEQLDGVEFLVVGSSAAASLEAVTKLAEGTGRARWMPVGSVPWPIVMPSVHSAIEEFLFDDRGGRPR
jgi:pimeloyl-ACP methyl ester carboxylesterase